MKPRRLISLDGRTLTLRLAGVAGGQKFGVSYQLDPGDLDHALTNPDFLKWHWDQLEEEWQKHRALYSPEL